jgi:PUA domain protein
MKKIVVKKRHSIRKSQAQDILSRLSEQIGPSARFFHADMIEVLETNANVSLFMVNKKMSLMDNGTWVFPTLRGAILFPFPERRVVVDAGAIPYVVNGADVMRPGIVSISDDVKADAPVQIVDERHGKPLAIGIALFDAPDMRAKIQGKMCKNFHHVSDEIWNIEI